MAKAKRTARELHALAEAIEACHGVKFSHPFEHADLVKACKTRDPEYAAGYISSVIEISCIEAVRALMGQAPRKIPGGIANYLPPPKPKRKAAK